MQPKKAEFMVTETRMMMVARGLGVCEEEDVSQRVQMSSYKKNKF